MKLAGLLLALVATAAAKDGFCKVAECKACKEGAGINYLASLPLLTRSLGSVSHDVSRRKSATRSVYAWGVCPRPTLCLPLCPRGVFPILYLVLFSAPHPANNPSSIPALPPPFACPP